MADLKQVQKDAPDALDQFKSAVDTLSDVLGTVSKLTTLIGIGDLVSQLTKMFLPGKPDPVTAALTAIQQKLDTILHFEVADAEKEHMFQVDALTQAARANWRTLFEIQFDFNNPLVRIDDLEKNTSIAANELAQQDHYWLRPFYDGLLITDALGATFIQGPTPPLDLTLGPGLPQVFDYRLTLPAFLYAIQIRCGFILALHQARPAIETARIVDAFKQTEVQPMLSRLESVYGTMVAGVVSVPVPKNSEELTAWNKNGSRVGVVDIYARLGNIEQFFDQGFIKSELAFAVFQARLGLNNVQHWKNWYAHAGFGATWSSIQNVRALLGEAPDSFDKNALWSVKDVAAALGATFVKIIPGISLPLSAVIEGLVLVGRPGVSIDPVVRPLSFRGALQAALTAQVFVG
jgi:hypothetical protein